MLMQIVWHGQSCFQITTLPKKNSQVGIVIDPFDESIGLKLPSLEADILLISHGHPDHNNVKAVSPLAGSGRTPFLISGPGEYEIKEIILQGIASFHDDSQGRERGENTIYTIETEEIKICHLGDFGQKELAGPQLEEIGTVDVLIIPVGGIPHQNQWWGTISAKEAIKIMSQIEPKIIIPMHYQIPRLKIKLEGVDGFLKMLGAKKIEPLNKLSIKKKDLSEEEAKIVVLKP